MASGWVAGSPRAEVGTVPLESGFIAATDESLPLSDRATGTHIAITMAKAPTRRIRGSMCPDPVPALMLVMVSAGSGAGAVTTGTARVTPWRRLAGASFQNPYSSLLLSYSVVGLVVVGHVVTPSGPVGPSAMKDYDLSTPAVMKTQQCVNSMTASGRRSSVTSAVRSQVRVGKRRRPGGFAPPGRPARRGWDLNPRTTVKWSPH